MKTKLPKASPADGLFWQIKTMLTEAPVPEREYLFFAARRWKFDLAWPDRLIAVEVEGGTWSRKTDAAGTRRVSRHTTGAGHREDCLKYNVAAILGWTVLRFPTDMVLSGEALAIIALVDSKALTAACMRLSDATRRPRRRR